MCINEKRRVTTFVAPPERLTHRCAFHPPSGLMYSMWSSHPAPQDAPLNGAVYSELQVVFTADNIIATIISPHNYTRESILIVMALMHF